jgi:hypothetical protein
MYRGLTNLFDSEGNLIVTINSSVYIVNGRRILDPNNAETQLNYPILRRLLIEQRRQAAAARSNVHEPNRDRLSLCPLSRLSRITRINLGVVIEKIDKGEVVKGVESSTNRIIKLFL